MEFKSILIRPSLKEESRFNMAFTGHLGHLEIESPWGNAGGVAKTLDEVEQMARTGVGWIEAGSYTLEPRIGNSPNGERTYYHDAETEETYNSLGMPNKGMDVLEKEIPEMVEVARSLGKSIIFNVAPVTDNPVEESKELVARAYEAGAEAVLLNAGCPNVIKDNGDRHELLSHDEEMLSLVLGGLLPVAEKFKPVFIRTSPLQKFGQAKQIYTTIQRQRGVVGAIFTPNTFPGYKPLDDNGELALEVPRNIGGKSGPATKPEATVELWRAVRELKPFYNPSPIDIVSSGGIGDGQTLSMRLLMGAVAGAGTTLYYQSADNKLSWGEATDKLLREHAE